MTATITAPLVMGVRADQVIAHTNLYWQYQTAPGRRGGMVPADSVDLGGTTA